MPSYFNRDNVDVFPSAYRTYRTDGRFTSETNFVNYIKSFIHLGSDENPTYSFVADYIPQNQTTGTPDILKVIIDGYYFEIKNFNPAGHKNCTLKINVNSGYLFSIKDNTSVLDPNGSSDFVGLAFGSGGTSTASLKVTDGEGNIINTCYIKELCDPDGKFINIKNIFKQDKNGEWYIDYNIINWGTPQNPNYHPTVGSRGLTSQPIYFKNGVPTKSLRITASTSTPSGTGHQAGDVWFIIEN